MSTGGHPADPDEEGDVTRRLPVWHPHRTQPPDAGLPRVRHYVPLNHRHFDALVSKINRNNRRLEAEHEQDFEDLWAFLCELAETPDSIVLRHLLQLVQELLAKVADLESNLDRLVGQFQQSSGEFAEAATEFLANR